MGGRDLRYGRRGGRWQEGTAAEAIAVLEDWRAAKAAAAAADLERDAAEQLDLFDG